MKEKRAKGKAREYFSPAKLNLFFRILRKRGDGYHEIASLYTAINFGDTLTFLPQEEDAFEVSGLFSLPLDSSNLVIKARDAFRKKTNLFQPVSIILHKKIPPQSGLGGGSSNASTTLWAMNELHGNPLTTLELISLAATLGSDPPFFLSKGLAYCQGRGEILQEIEEPLDLSFYLACPSGIAISTPKAYEASLKEDYSSKDPLVLLSELLQGVPSFTNDLEPAAIRLSPSLQDLKKSLYESFHTVTLTGSGSAFFCSEPKLKSSLPLISLIRRPAAQWYTPRS